jgi:SAM-dependent methyltransferase
MGLLPQIGQFIIREHLYKAITGRILTIGRQTIHITPEHLKIFLEQQGLPAPPPEKIAIDVSTSHATMNRFVDDKTFFGSFSSAQLNALDHSDFEGADIVCDLNRPVPPALEEQFDFIYNGSVLDNVWDPATGMRNMTRLLKPGGRIVHLEHGTRVNGPYLTFPPDWFHDYYAINHFADCKTYTATFPTPDRWNGKLNWIYWEPLAIQGDAAIAQGMFVSPSGEFFSICIAEKGSDSSWDKVPNQFQYRSPEERREHLLQTLKFKQTGRPVVRFS